MGLYLADRHPSGVERQNLVVKAAPAGLVLRDQLRLKGAVAVTRDFDRQFAELSLQVFLLLPLRVLPAGFSTGSFFPWPRMVGHLRFQRLLDQQLGQLLEQPVLANQVFRFR